MIRSAKVVISSGNYLCRPLNLLYPIEVDNEGYSEEVKTEIPLETRDVRKCALEARKRIQEQLK